MKCNSIYVIAVAVFFLGVLFLLLGIWLEDHTSATYRIWLTLPGETGKAFIIASVLAVTVDHFFKQQLAKDVLEATLGYIIPKEFDAELRWLLAPSIFAENSQMTVYLKKLASGNVKVTVEVERTVRNFSQISYRLNSAVGVDDFGLESPGAVIEDCRIMYGEIKMSGNCDKAREKKIERQTEYVDLKPGDAATIAYKFHQVKAENDDLWWFFFSHTRNQRVTVVLETEMAYTVEFIARDMGRTKIGPYKTTYTLEGVLLTTQPIKVRWWPNNVAS